MVMNLVAIWPFSDSNEVVERKVFYVYGSFSYLDYCLLKAFAVAKVIGNTRLLLIHLLLQIMLHFRLAATKVVSSNVMNSILQKVKAFKYRSCVIVIGRYRSKKAQKSKRTLDTCTATQSNLQENNR